MSAIECVWDASALLALLQREPGQATATAWLPGAALSSVNWSEVVQKTLARQGDIELLRQGIAGLGIRIVPFAQAEAERAARLWPQTQPLGLSLGDRACLALALEQGVPVLTPDRAWTQLALDCQIELIR
jgi:PIN domain nuclease of toxin-antitoxin system